MHVNLYLTFLMFSLQLARLAGGPRAGNPKILIGKPKEGAMTKDALNAFFDDAQNDHRECN